MKVRTLGVGSGNPLIKSEDYQTMHRYQTSHGDHDLWSRNEWKRAGYKMKPDSKPCGLGCGRFGKKYYVYDRNQVIHKSEVTNGK